MAIQFDSSSVGYLGYGGSIPAFSHNVGSGANRILLVGVTVANNSDKITSVTFGGQTLTRQRAELGGAVFATYIYSLINPPTGANNISVTFSGGDIASVAIAATFTGVDQTTPFLDIQGISNGYANSPFAVAVSNAADGMAVSLVGTGGTAVDTSILFSNVSSTLIAQSDNSAVDAGNMLAAMSYALGANSMSWTWSGSERGSAQTVVALKSASSGGGDTTAPTFTGTVVASNITQTAVTLTWPAATDNVAVTGYEVSLDNTSWSSVGNVLTTTVGSLTAASSYTAKVRAFDAAGNKSTALSVNFSTEDEEENTASFTTDKLINNTGTPLSGIMIYWSWFSYGRIGSFGENTPIEGSEFLDIDAILTITNLPAGPGILLISQRNTSAAEDDDVFYMAGTAS